MITQNLFTIDWINQVSKRHKADKILVEKSIRALSLLEGLSESSLPFVFKGGTALMLIFKEPHRLSIDIDIILPLSNPNLTATLQQIAMSKGFSRIEEQSRKSGIVPKTHYKFFYTSAVENKESYILLDILFEQIPYNRIIELPITNIFLATEGEDRTVRVPDINNLLADKLTAFAPRTVGVPYRKGNSECGMEIMKQLYDIGALFDKADDMVSLSAVYRTIAEQEASYRDKHFSVDDILHDTMDHALSICFRKSQNDVEYQVLERGIKQLSSHIFSEPFHIEEAILSAAKAYYLVSQIETDGITIEKYSSRQLERMRNWLFTDYEYTKLNKLKKSNPEAFFYLYLAIHR